jgi:hypothetical protein
MEAAWFASMMFQPVPVAIALAVVVLMTFLVTPKKATPPLVSRRQLFFGYLGVFAVCVLIAAGSSYVSPDEAWSVWKVPPENYWHALMNQFLVQVVLLTGLSVVGAAIIGAPIVVALSRRRLATVPWVLVASALVSLVFTGMLMAVGSGTSNTGFWQLALFVLGTHLALSLGFCIAARLGWRLRQAP